MLTLSDIISPAYRAQCQLLHANDPSWGTSGAGALQHPKCRSLISEARFGRILDYGAGKGQLARDGSRLWPEKLFQSWDPTWPMSQSDPLDPRGSDGGRVDSSGSWAWMGFADLVICLDVMEHVEPGQAPNGRSYVENVLEDIRLSLNPAGPRKVLFGIATSAAISMLPATAELPSRNAHLIVEHWGWWWARLEDAGYTVVSADGDFLKPGPSGLLALVTGAPAEGGKS